MVTANIGFECFDFINSKIFNTDGNAETPASPSAYLTYMPDFSPPPVSSFTTQTIYDMQTIVDTIKPGASRIMVNVLNG